MFLFFFDNLYEVSTYRSTPIHVFFLKLNSDYNIFLMLLYILILAVLNDRFLRNTTIIFFFVDALVQNPYCSLLGGFITKSKINADLTNGLLVIHPICLYSLVAILFVILVTINSHAFNKYCLTVSTLGTKKLLFVMSLVLLFSIYLGCWWAQLELSWGGWWGWDFVEIVSLNYLLIAVLLLHSKQQANYLTVLFYDFTVKVLLYIFIIKFSYLDSIHNFASLDIFLQNFYQFTLLFALALFLINRLKFSLGQLTLHKSTLTYNIVFSLFWAVNFYFYMYLFFEFFSLFFKNSSVSVFFLKNKDLISLLLFIFVLTRIHITNNIPLPLPQALWEQVYVYFIMSFRQKSIVSAPHLLILLLLYTLTNNIFFYNYGFTSHPYNSPIWLKTIGVDQYQTSVLSNQYLQLNLPQGWLFGDKYTIDKSIFSPNKGLLLEYFKLTSPVILLLSLDSYSALLLMIFCSFYFYWSTKQYLF